MQTKSLKYEKYNIIDCESKIVLSKKNIIRIIAGLLEQSKKKYIWADIKIDEYNKGK